jgi:HK97 family phage major capsid protein
LSSPGWTNTQITAADPTTDELVITPKKVAALTYISNEAAADTNPAVAEMTGRSIGRSIAKKVDSAWFAASTTNGPAGLLSATGINTVDISTYALTSLDGFHKGKADALADGANLTHWLVAPDVALTLSTVKELTTGSNVNLLGPAGIGDGTLIAGVPVIVSTDVAAGNVWGVDASQIILVQRQGTTLTRSTDVKFDYDSVAVRGVARVSWGFANPAGIVRYYDAP